MNPAGQRGGFRLEPLVSMRGISKRFPGVLANERVNFDVRPGEVHALVGENGAGKSTLMNVLYGLYRPDEGEIRFRGRPVQILRPLDAIRLGIGMVHQHFMLVGPLTVAENVVLGVEPGPGPLFDMAAAVASVRETSHRFGLALDPEAVVEELPVGLQQRVEIVKALYRGADLLILDEPTAVLTPQEARELFAVIRRLTAGGKAVVFISHKLNEVLAIADRITVMRGGRVAGVRPAAGTTREQLAELMVGRPVLLRVRKEAARPGAPVFRLENGVTRERPPKLNGLALEVRAGEILGLAGVEGNGQAELIEVMIGLRRLAAGRIWLLGRDVTGWAPRRLRDAGIGHVAADRHRQGVVLDMTVAENLILGHQHGPPFSRRGLLKLRAVREHARRLQTDYDIRGPGTEVRIRLLSGGNQQKAVVAREADRAPALLIAAHPTRGVDIGAIEFIHRRLIALRDAGKAILLISGELEEILSLADRIAVIYEGRIVGVVTPARTTAEELGRMMGGGGAAGVTSGAQEGGEA
jgi:general nucleoside transport system ATP-binding protein